MSRSMSLTTLDEGKTGRFSQFLEGRLPPRVQIKRWDGAARNSVEWDNLRRDPELWHRGGNCFIHLYGRGQSRRGPAFKIPFSTLLSAQCHPLIERFVAWDAPNSPGTPGSSYSTNCHEEFELWNHLNPTGKVELYIPPPPGANKEQSFRYHLATRNFIAWLCRRSVVGESLSEALVGVMNSMHEFRLPGQDNVRDLIDYLEEEGYLEMRDQPDHALAILHLAEAFHLRGMYIDAFAHCAGMNNRLHASSEYRLTSNISRTLIRQAKVELDLRLIEASAMLRSFLEDELSDAHLGLTPGARAHMERFRSFLLSFYTTKLGYYPPKPVSTQTGIFGKEVYDIMRDDFECLHELLVDEAFTSADNSPFLAHGGICAVQSVHSFDLRCRYRSLEHPLPLLPEVPATPPSRRMSWFTRANKLRPDGRLLAHAALIKASNNWKSQIFRNDLVQAYRTFEEDSIVSPSKVDKKEKLSLADARKVRWILIYAIYQVLRNVTEPPTEVCDIEGISYHVAISSASLPPWKEGKAVGSLVRRQTQMISTPWGSGLPSTPETPAEALLEIKPDIDYFALTHRSTTAEPTLTAVQKPPPAAAPRSRSLTRNLTRTNEAFRRSLSLFRTPTQTRPTTPVGRKYHEIVVHGYGNGTNPVQVEAEAGAEAETEPEPQPQPQPENHDTSTAMATRSLSNSSKSSSTCDSDSHKSTATSATSAETSPVVDSKMDKPAVPWQNASHIVAPIPTRGRRREVVSLFPTPLDRTDSPLSSRRRPSSAVFSTSAPASRPRGSSYAVDYALLVEEQREEMDREELEPSPLRIQKSPCAAFDFNNPDSWDSLQTHDHEGREGGEAPEWENYAGLGGHIQLAPATS